jgi:SpoVK/Ycf46/Vps4 family AAA+-type ATPase
MPYAEELTALADKKLIKANKNGNRRYGHNKGEITYRIPQKVTEALLKNEAYVPVATDISITEFFAAIEDLFIQRVRTDEITYEELKDEIDTLLSDNQELDFVKKLREYDLLAVDRMLLIRFCHYYVNLDQDEMDLHTLSEMFEHKSIFANHKRQLLNGEHNLITKGIIENTNSDGFNNRESFKLTDKVKRELLADLQIKKTYNSKDMILAKNIQDKKLFYNETEAEQVARIVSLLKTDSFKDIQARLLESNMRTGFACLFYGAPGCGKTETVYQIARQTGRDILMVDIAETKSMWFGESEKKIKEVFVRYRNLVDEAELTPILLINEADAVIGKRKDVSKSSVAQTENAIQNIILQELENLKGILIATTNLTENMDKAFERRFLYKIEFKKPDSAVRQSIWKAMLPSLSDDDAKAVASCFNFSGGQIENIARKRTVEYILSGIEPSLERLTAFCREELLNKEAEKRIGFGAY